jgi:hypothetical protein
MHNWIIIDDLLVSVNVAGWKYPELNGGPTSWKKHRTNWWRKSSKPRLITAGYMAFSENRAYHMETTGKMRILGYHIFRRRCISVYPSFLAGL